MEGTPTMDVPFGSARADWSNAVYLILLPVDSSLYASIVCGFRSEDFLTLLGCVRIVKPTRRWEANVWPGKWARGSESR